jgi:hypothetical protein
MSDQKFRLAAMACSVLGLLLVTGGLLYADPPADGCSDRCQVRMFFIDSPSLKCFKYDDEDCLRCSFGRCKDGLVGPVQPCIDTTFTAVEKYPAGSCEPLCTLNLNQSAEVITINGTREDRFTLTWNRCKGE